MGGLRPWHLLVCVAVIGLIIWIVLTVTRRPSTADGAKVQSQVLYDAQGQPVQVVGARGGTNPLAIVSLVLSLVGFGLPAVITGVIARNQIRQHGGDGDGIARAGLVIGSLETVAAVILVVVAIA